MKFRSVIISIMLLLWWGFDARAQAPEQMPVPEQWQLTLDVIKAKVQALVIKNNGLQVEYRHLAGQAQRLQQLINDQQYKNELANRFLEEQEAKPSQETVRPPVDDQMAQLRKQLEDESTQEVLLENELRSLKAADRVQNLDAPSLNTDERRGYRQKKRKEQLEADIYAYESRMEELRQSSLTVLSWPLKKKAMVHDMVGIDARNNQMRDNIKVLHEDIDILKDQVARLERRVNFIQDKGTKI